MSEDGARIAEIYPRRTLTAVRLGGPLLIILLSSICSLVIFTDVAGIFTLDFAVVVGFLIPFATLFVMPILVEVLLRSLREPLTSDYRFGLRFFPIRLVLNAMTGWLIWLLLSFFVLVGTVLVATIVPIFRFSPTLALPFVTILASLPMGWVAPYLVRLNVPLRSNMLREQAKRKQNAARAALDTGNIESAEQRIDELKTLLQEQDTLAKREVSTFQDTAGGFANEVRYHRDEKADTRVEQKISSIESNLEKVDDEFDVSRLDDQLQLIESTLDTCEAAASFNEKYDLGRSSEIEQFRSRLQERKTEGEKIRSLKRQAEEKRDGARRALQSRAYDSVDEALDELRETLDELGKYAGTNEVVSDLRSDIRELEEQTAVKVSESRVDGLLGASEQARKRATELLDDGDVDRAITRLESGRQSVSEAAELENRFDLGREDAISSKREAIESLLTQAKSQPTEDLAEHLNAAEAAVARGIDERNAGKPAAAYDEFSDAFEDYEAALQLVRTHDLAEQWEVEQRHSMVAEYREITREERDERRQSVQTDLERALDAAESALDRSEQHDEVDDPVAARESHEDAVGHLGEASQLLATGVVEEEFSSRYETLAARADRLDDHLPDPDESGEYRNRDLVESLQILATKLGESPRPEFVNSYGEFPADAYLEAFGSWPEALAAANLDQIDEAARERRKYTRVDILDSVADVTAKLGHTPSTNEMNEHGEMSAPTVESRFSDWETAIDLARRQNGENHESGARSEPDSPRQTQTGANTSPESSIQPNELAELYELFGSLETTIDSLISAEEAIEYGDGSPLAKWCEAVFDYWAGDGSDDAPNYGDQQHRRNEFRMAEYREAFGDGDEVTEFRAIETAPLKDSDRAVLLEQGILREDQSIVVPVSPETGHPLPVAVRSDAELRRALELLNEFPSWPDADTSPDTDHGETQSTEQQSDTEAGSDDIVGQLLNDMDFDADPNPGGE